MTLLSICQNVALDLGVAVPGPPVFGSQVPAAQRLFAQARRAAQSIWRKAPWSALTVEYTFSAAGNSDFQLPPDFGWMIDDTLWERSRYWALRGAMSPQKWQLYKSSIYGRATIWRRWRIRIPSGAGAGAATAFSIDPPIAANDQTSSFVFEYVSKNWCISCLPGRPDTPAADWTGDNDETVLDEWLVELDTRWRMLRRLGLAYDEDKDEAEREIDKAVARDAGTATLDLVPASRRDDFIGQYTLGAFPPVPAPPDPAPLVAPARAGLPLAPPGPPRLPVTPRLGDQASRRQLGRAPVTMPRPAPLSPAGAQAPVAPRRPRLYQPPMSDE